MGKRGDQFIIILDITRVFSLEDAALLATAAGPIPAALGELVEA